MAGTTQVTPAELATMANKTSQTNSAVQGELGKVRGIVDSTRADWVGAAQGAFATLMVTWDADAKKLNDALMGISDTLAASGRTFDAQQADHVAQINQVAGSLNM